jgi:hypothetical protein
LGFSSGGTERDWEQTGHGGSEGWIRHRALGTALEHPVPRNTNDDDEACAGGVSSPAAAVCPLGTAAAAIGLCRSETANSREEAEWCAEAKTGSNVRRCAEFVWEKGGFAHWHMCYKLFSS